jgi:uncharacterized membrane protein HdeD (DUF308 family)
VLFSLSGLAFAFQVAPLQRKLLALAQAAKAGEPWEGVLAILTPLAALTLMVVKPLH